MAERRLIQKAWLRGRLPKLLGSVNCARKQTGFDSIPHTALRLRRTVVKPFDCPSPVRLPSDISSLP
ncbi:MAG: hypothetical protein AAGI34_14205 [Pseudomonadota bacterium]